VHLTPKALALLSYMADRPGEVITKDQLFNAVWPEVSVGDAALVTCIQELRRALKDDARRPRFIETLHRRGYRFVGKLAEASPTSAIHGNASELALPDRPSIAVLPFVNMSEDSEDAHFADGISEDLITGLSRIHWLFVIARNSTFVYKGRAVDVKQVARELGVRYVLEGSVRRAGKRIRISAQLIDATTGGHHWAERYDRELDDIFAVQDEITRNVVAAIEPRLMAAISGRTWSLGVRGACANLCLAPDAGRQSGRDQRPQPRRRILSRLHAGAKSIGLLPGVCRAQWLDRSQSRVGRRQPAYRTGRRTR
jgi:TolB-like protein